jgi:hypothetical protein
LSSVNQKSLREEFDQFKDLFDRLLKKELPSIPPKLNGKKGRIVKSDAHKLRERLKEHEVAVLLFTKIPHVHCTNNRAERDLRMSKVKQKVSGCFRTFKLIYRSILPHLKLPPDNGK